MALEVKIFPRSESPGFLLCQTATQLKAGLFRAFQAHGIKITPEQWTVLGSLWEQDRVHQSRLAEKTAKDRHNIARILNLLEKGGLVRREPDRHDQRLRKVCLTEEGKALEPELVRIASDFLRRSLSGLTQEDLNSMIRILKQIVENVSKDSRSVEALRFSKHDHEVQRSEHRSTRKRFGNVLKDHEV